MIMLNDIEWLRKWCSDVHFENGKVADYARQFEKGRLLFADQDKRVLHGVAHVHANRTETGIVSPD